MNRLALWCIGISFVTASCGLTPTATQPVDLNGTVSLLSERSPNPRAFGDPKAPIVMREFSDFQ